MNIRKLDAADKQDVERWVRFPFELHKHNPLWVPPLLSGARAQLDPQKHPYYQHSTADFFLAEARGKTLGRIALLHNTRYNQYLDENSGHFAMFEVFEDLNAARALFERAFEWCAGKGFNRVHGPKGLLGADSSGVLVEGFEHRPALNVPYNFPYYDHFIQDSGFVKLRDSLSGYIDVTNTELNPRVEQIASRVMEKRGLWIKTFKDKAELRSMVPKVRKVHHQAFIQGYGYYPHTEDEFQYVVDELFQIAEPSLIKLVMKGDQVIGFLFAYHDISAGLQKAGGRLLPFGWLHILLDKRQTEWVNLNGVGILPEFQGRGANAVLYTEMAKSILSYNFKHAETVRIGEENYRSFADNTSMGVRWYKRHRTYQKEL